MNRQELVSAVAEKTGFSKKQVDETLAVILDQIKANSKVSIQKFGVFTMRTRPAHEGRNPQTGATVQVAENTKLHFKVSDNA